MGLTPSVAAGLVVEGLVASGSLGFPTCSHQMAAMVFTTNAAMSWSGELHGERRGVVVAGGDGRDGMWLNDLINCAQQGGVQLTGQGGCCPR